MVIWCFSEKVMRWHFVNDEKLEHLGMREEKEFHMILEFILICYPLNMESQTGKIEMTWQN